MCWVWDGRILRIRISRPVNNTQYSVTMWSHVLRKQLEVKPAAFWDCVRHSELPDRGAPTPRDMRKPLPLYLYRELRKRGVSEDKIAELDVGEAAELYAKLLRDEPEEC